MKSFVAVARDEQRTDGVDDGGVAILCGQCLHRRHLEHPIDRRQDSSYVRVPRVDHGRFPPVA